MAIKEFRDDYAFLSNFYQCKVEYKGVRFPTAEHAFQYQKIKPNTEVTEYWQQSILDTNNPSVAKSIGLRVPIIKNWDDSKVGVMTEIVKAKFDQNPDLRKKLVATGKEKLVEGNYWNDEFWGVSLHSNKGLNMLGQILMDLRDYYS